jgi:hypothetical protein
MSQSLVLAPERLNAQHDVSQFDNGKHPSLDAWLKGRALASEGMSARTYVVCARDARQRIAGTTRYRPPWNSESLCQMPSFGGPCQTRCLCYSSVDWPLIEGTRAKDWEQICCRMGSGDASKCRRSPVYEQSLLTPLMTMRFASISTMDFFVVPSAIGSCSCRSKL